MEKKNKEEYLIVNAGSGRPVFAIGFCNCYSDKTKADEAADRWNVRRSPSICKVKVITKQVD